MTVGGLFYDFGVTALILCAALGLGWLTLRLLRIPEKGLFSLWLGLSAGLGLLSLLTLLLGLAGFLVLWLWLPFLILLALCGIWLLANTFRAQRAALFWPKDVSNPADYIVSYGLLAVGLSSLIWMLLSHSLLPPTDWDALAYHLELPKTYVEAGQIIYVPDNVTANWPLGFEMLFALALLLRSDIAANLIMLSSSALTAIGLLIGSRRYCNDRVGALAFALFLCIPLVKRLGGVAMIDAAIGLYTLGIALCFIRWQQDRQRSWLILCGLYCGFAASSKLMGAGLAILFGLLFLWDAGQRLLGAKWARGTFGQIGLEGLAFGLAGLAMIGPWYLRSYFFTGNPIWPFAYNLFGGRNWDHLGDEYHMQLLIDIWTVILPRNPIGLVQSFGYLLLRPEELGGYRGGLGIPALLGAIAVLALLRWAPKLLRQALFISTGFWILWFALVSHQSRYLLPVAPLLVLCMAWACVWLIDRLPQHWMRQVLFAATIGLALLSWPWLDSGERGLFLAKQPYLKGNIDREAYLVQQIDAMPLFNFANQNFSPEANVLLLPYETRSYYLERPHIWGNLTSQRYLRFEQQDSTEALLATLQSMGVTHIIDNPTLVFTQLRYWEYARELMLDLETRCSTLLFEQGQGRVFSLNQQCVDF